MPARTTTKATGGAQVATLGHVRELPIDAVKLSAENNRVYQGFSWDNEDDRRLYFDVEQAGRIREPLILTPDYDLVSGHRRIAVAELRGMATVPVLVDHEIRRMDYTSDEWTALLVQHNSHRDKDVGEILNERIALRTSEDAHAEHVKARSALAAEQNAQPSMAVTQGRDRGVLSDEKSDMIEAILRVLEENGADLPLSVRRVHYLIATGVTRVLRNTNKNRWPKMRRRKNGRPEASEFYGLDKWSAKDLSGVLTRLRCDGRVPWDSIIDETRPSDQLDTMDNVGDFLSRELKWFLRNYRRNCMQSQRDHYEVFVEKLGLRHVISEVCDRYAIRCSIGKGYSSSDLAYRMAARYRQSAKDRLIVFILTDFDPPGLEIAAALVHALYRDHGIDERSLVCVRVGIDKEQAEALGLPQNNEPKDVPKSATFIEEHGRVIYELDAAKPDYLRQILDEAIRARIDVDLFNAEIAKEQEDSVFLDAARQRAMAAMEGVL